MKVTALCFYWRGELQKGYHYGPEYVNTLQRMLRRHLSVPHELVCVTDEPEGIEARTVPLPAELRRLGEYWPKLYAFHPDGAALFGPRLLMLDLDLVLVGSIDGLASRPEPFVAWSAQERDLSHYNTSFVLMDAGAFPEVWERFDDTCGDTIEALGYARTDQDWVSYVIGDRGARWARSGEGIESYQQVRRKLPANAAVISFNGRRSPAMKRLQQESPWIAEHWR